MKKIATYLAAALALAIVLSTPAGAAFCAKALDFDGTNDDLDITAGLTGSADVKDFLFSGWFRLSGGDSTNRNIINTSLDRVHVGLNSSDEIFIRLESTDNGIVYTCKSTTTFTGDTDWHHLMLSADAANGVEHVYLDGSVMGLQAVARADKVIDYTVGPWKVGGKTVTGFGGRMNGDLAEIYMAAEFLDLSVAGNRLKFYSASGTAVNLGAGGAKPTGTQPLIYVRGEEYGVNRGTGGDFGVTGSPEVVDGPNSCTVARSTSSCLGRGRRGGRGGRSSSRAGIKPPVGGRIH